jgi:hypothetical protein
MGTRKLLTINLLVLFLCLASNVFAQCKKIEAEARVVEVAGASVESKTSSIVIDFKGRRSEDFTVSLFGPKKNNELNTDKSEFRNLSKGAYLIVIVGKKEGDNYCPQSINITIN